MRPPLVVLTTRLTFDGRVIQLLTLDQPSGYKYVVELRKLYNFFPGEDETFEFKVETEAISFYNCTVAVDKVRQAKRPVVPETGTAVAENPLHNSTMITALRIVSHLIHGTGTAGPAYAPTLAQLHNYVGRELDLHKFEDEFLNLTDGPGAKFPIY